MKMFSLPKWIVTLIVLTGIITPAMALTGGVARCDITPPPGGLMYGFAARGTNVSTGIHDPLLARVLVLRSDNSNMVLICLDLGDIAKESMDAIRTAVKDSTGLENLVFAVSHSHSSGLFQEDFPSKEAPWARDVEAKVIEAVKEAAANPVPVTIGAGEGRLEEGHNRRLVHDDGKVEMMWGNKERIPTTPLDYTVGVIRVAKEDGSPLATLVNFTSHPVILGDDNLQLSADYPGAMARRIEETTGGQCMFLQGACGDINPFGDKTSVDNGGFAEVERMGYALADEAMRILKTIETTATDREITFSREIISLAPRRNTENEGPIEAEVNTITIGNDIALATFPGEFFVEHQLSLKKRATFTHTYFVGYSNGVLSYFPTIRASIEGGYGADRGVYVEPGAGEYLVNRALINLHRQTGRLW